MCALLASAIVCRLFEIDFWIIQKFTIAFSPHLPLQLAALHWPISCFRVASLITLSLHPSVRLSVCPCHKSSDETTCTPATAIPSHPLPAACSWLLLHPRSLVCSARQFINSNFMHFRWVFLTVFFHHNFRSYCCCCRCKNVFQCYFYATWWKISTSTSSLAKCQWVAC